MTPDAALARYAEFWETITRARVGALAGLVDADVRFKDPFNDVRGVGRMIAVVDASFGHGRPSYTVSDRALGRHGAGYLRWRCELATRAGSAPWRFEGMTEVRLDAAGRVTAHLDHWDAAEQFYERLAGVGAVLRLIKRRLQA